MALEEFLRKCRRENSVLDNWFMLISVLAIQTICRKRYSVCGWIVHLVWAPHSGTPRSGGGRPQHLVTQSHDAIEGAGGTRTQTGPTGLCALSDDAAANGCPVLGSKRG